MPRNGSWIDREARVAGRRSSAQHLPRHVRVPSVPAVTQQAIGKGCSGPGQRAFNLVSTEERLVVSGQFCLDVILDQRGWIRVLSAIEKYFSLGYEPDQIPAIIVVVVKALGARANGGNLLSGERAPLEPGRLWG